MLRSPALALAATLAVSLAACGSSDSAVTPQTAKTTVEHAAGLQLAPVKLPADAREQGLRASVEEL